MKKKNSWIKIAAVLTTIIGGAVAVAAYIKNKSKRLSDELDFDNSLYFDEDTSMLDEDEAVDMDSEVIEDTVESESEDTDELEDLYKKED